MKGFDTIRCASCGEVWPCPRAGGEHISRGELEARVAAAERRQKEKEAQDKRKGA